MSRAPRLLGRSGFMHIYSRGVNKQDIFLKKTDYNYFLEKLSALSDEMGFEILAYCLMPNHYHLVLFDENARYSTIIKRLSTSYVMHFNNKYSRVGPLFQGRFCGKPIEDDIYLMMSHINSYNRKKLNNQSSHQLFSFLHGKNVLDTLNIKLIPANEINLTPLLLKK